jgi:hypothetical protein
MTNLYFHPNTQVLLYLGGMKPINKIERGDILIGRNNNPIVALGVNHTKLPLNIIKIKDEEFLSNYNGNILTGLINYPKQSITNDPYLIGLCSLSKNNNLEAIMKKYLNNKLDNLNKVISNKINTYKIYDSTNLEELNEVLINKYIPECYLYNSVEIRHRLLLSLVNLNNLNNLNNSNNSNNLNTYKLTSNSTNSTNSNIRSIIETLNNKVNSGSTSSSTSSSNLSSTLSSTLSSNLEKNNKIIINDLILLEQVKFLVKSLGYCYNKIDNVLYVIGDINKLPSNDINKLVEYSTIESTNIIDCCNLETSPSENYLLNNCVIFE